MSRTKKFFIGAALLALLCSAAVGCSQKKSLMSAFRIDRNADGDSSQGLVSNESKDETLQHNQGNLPKVKIGDVLSSPDSYSGEIMLEGRVVSVCGASGCWFVLEDGTGTIFVDLKPSNLTISQRKKGALVKVYGEVTKRGSDIYFVGKKVEL